MSKDNITILKNSSILYFRLVITSILGLVASRFVIQGLGVSDYGLYCVVGGIVVMLAFLNPILTSTTYRFITFEMGKNSVAGVNKVFNISLVIHLCLALLVLILTETAGLFYVKNYLNVEAGKTADALFVMRFSALATFFSVVSVPYQGLVTANEKFIVRATIEIIRALLAFIAALIIFYAEEKLKLYAVLIAIANGTPAFLFFAYCKKNYKEATKWKFRTEFSKYKEMLIFSGWVTFGGIAAIAKIQGAALIINAFFGTVLNAGFGVAKQVNGVVSTFSKNLGQAAVPQITKSFSSGNTNRSVSLAAYISKYTCFLMLIPSLPILLETDFLIKVWLDVVPPYTVVFCQLMIINELVESLGAGVPALVHATGKIKYFQIILSTTSLISLPFGYLLFKTGYPPYAIQIAFIATALLNVVMRQILLKALIDFDVKHFIKTSYFKILYVVLLTGPLFLIKTMLPYGVIRFFFFSSLSMIVLCAAIYFVGLEKKEQNFAIEIMQKILLRVNIRG